jgi:hypothetical protein
MDYTSLGPILIVEDDRKTVAIIALYLVLQRTFTQLLQER